MIKIQATEVQQDPGSTYVTVRVESISGYTIDRRTCISRTMLCQGVVTIPAMGPVDPARWSMCSRLRPHIAPSDRDALDAEVMQWLPGAFAANQAEYST
jgi:hypothetical protein